MVSSKDAKEVGIREHHTHNGICVAFHMRLSVEMKGHLAITQSRNAAGKTIKKRGVPTKSKSSATRATSELTNSTVIKQSNNSRGTLLLARLLWSILVSSSNLVRLITRQQNITLQSVWDVTDQH